MTIQLKPETEKLVQEKLASGEFQSIDEIIVQGIEAGRGKRHTQRPDAERRRANAGRASEQEWLKQHSVEYAGSWVALEGDRMVSCGVSAQQVLKSAKRHGIEQPLS